MRGVGLRKGWGWEGECLMVFYGFSKGFSMVSRGFLRVF